MVCSNDDAVVVLLCERSQVQSLGLLLSVCMASLCPCVSITTLPRQSGNR